MAGREEPGSNRGLVSSHWYQPRAAVPLREGSAARDPRRPLVSDTCRARPTHQGPALGAGTALHLPMINSSIPRHSPTMRPRTYGPPRLQGCYEDRSVQSASTYPVSGSCPGQDGDPRSLVLIITPVSSDRSMVQVSRLPFDCQAIFSSPPADHWNHLLISRQLRIPYSYAAAIAGSKPRSLRSTAQTMRASLAASATTTMFLCARSDRPRAHRPSGVS
jgi:hypothetical protein